MGENHSTNTDLNSKDPPEDKVVSKDAIWNATVDESRDLYKLILTVATLFLSGTLAFLKQFPSPVKYQCISFIGCLLLIASIALSIFVRLNNLEIGRSALIEDWLYVDKIYERNKILTYFMISFLIIGIIFIAAFFMANFY